MSRITSKLRRRQLDDAANKLKDAELPPRGYIHEVREALEMSSYDLAERMGVAQSTVMDLEEGERNGSITLRSLDRAAKALGCKLVYAFVPEKSLQQIVEDQARNRALELSKSVFRTMALEQQSTDPRYRDDLIEELAADILRKGKRELWKK